MNVLHLCQPGYEQFLARELEGAPWATQGAGAPPIQVQEVGLGYLLARSLAPPAEWLENLCFTHLAVVDPREITAGSVNAAASALLDLFLSDFRDVRVQGRWYFDAWVRRDQEGLARRASGVKEVLLEKIKPRMSRVAKLATANLPASPGRKRGWVMFFAGSGRVLAGSDLYVGGQCRMADDPAAPSRSYLKVEEAYRVLGRAPVEGERVADLGAAPGGWSYSAARRGATVDAVDNGPLKSGAASHPGIRHLREDGFRFGPPSANEPYDWLFCDMVEDPYRILRLLEHWTANGWCRRFVINLKFGRTDPMALLKEAALLRSRGLKEWPVFRLRHLFHDREEVTIVGDAGGSSPELKRAD